MIFKCFTGGPFFTNGFLVADEEGGTAALFDAPHGVHDEIIAFLEEHNLKLEAIYLTHSHFDHLGDLAKLKKTLGLKIFVHAADRRNVVQPGADGVPLMIPTEGTEVDEELKEGQDFAIGQINFRVIETPGHSPGSVTFIFSEQKFVINGDVIFQGARGRTDLPGCDEKVLFQSIKKILDLGDDITIYSGHGDTTTVRQEKSNYE